MHASTFWAISRPRDNTRYMAFRSGAREAYSLHSKSSTRPLSLVCAMRPYCEWHFGEIVASQANMAEAISLAKELNDMHGLAVALYLCSEFSPTLSVILLKWNAWHRMLIELSTRHNFAHWLALGAILRGWARSASGDTVEGLSWIEDGIEDYRATGAIIGLPYFLAMKAEALHLADRTSEALEAIRRQKHWSKDLKSAFGVPNCTGSAVCFSRLWVLTRPKLRLHFAKPSASQGSRSRFR